MNHKLSIVIPCYNCEKTLLEAVDSCYIQDLETADFELVMVDDGSTDSTRNLIEEITSSRPNVRSIFHEKNKGGGAARNTGIKNAKGRYIYCLDSDNILAEGSLKMLIAHLEKKEADGVAFYERRFFSGTDPRVFSPQRTDVLNRSVTLADLFTEPSVLLDNFLFTKESYLKTEGFPEHHGFDTQSFEMRYLRAGNSVYVCPESIFYHRQLGANESYFEREYNKGNFSLFYFYCVEDIFDLLHPKAQEFIAHYDIFGNSSLKENLLKELKSLHAENHLFARSEEKAPAPVSLFASGIAEYRKKKYQKALESFTKASETGLSTPVVRFCIERCKTALSGIERNLIEKTTVQASTEFHTRPRRLYRKFDRLPFAGKIRKVIKFIKKWL